MGDKIPVKNIDDSAIVEAYSKLVKDYKDLFYKYNNNIDNSQETKLKLIILKDQLETLTSMMKEFDNKIDKLEAKINKWLLKNG